MWYNTDTKQYQYNNCTLLVLQVERVGRILNVTVLADRIYPGKCCATHGFVGEARSWD